MIFRTYGRTWWPCVSYGSRWASWAWLTHKSLVSLYAFDVTPWRSRGTRLTCIQKEPVSTACPGARQVLLTILWKRVQTLFLTITLNSFPFGRVMRLWSRQNEITPLTQGKNGFSPMQVCESRIFSSSVPDSEQEPTGEWMHLCLLG